VSTREEISQHDCRRLGSQERLPDLPRSQRCRPDPVPAQQLANRGRRDHMTELEQFTADSDAAPARIVLGHPQSQLLQLGIETWPNRATPVTEGCPPSWHQPAVPTQHRFRLDQYPGRPVHPLAQRRHDRPIRRIQLRSLDLTAYDSKLVPEKKQLCFSVADSQHHINQIEEQPKPGVHECEEHRRSKSYRPQATLLGVACPPTNKSPPHPGARGRQDIIQWLQIVECEKLCAVGIPTLPPRSPSS
jgi:hypothetical protein